MFVDGVIDNMKDVKSINKAIDEEGLLETRKILKEAFRKMDPYYSKKDNWKIVICRVILGSDRILCIYERGSFDK